MGDGTWSAACRWTRSAAPARAQMAVVLTTPGRPPGCVSTSPISGTWPAVAALPRQPRRAAAWAAGHPRPAPIGLAWRLLLALVGGMLLNLMPCVFPVLSLKVLGFARTRRTGACCSPAAWPTPPAWCCPSWRWPALLLALRAGGEQLGWGFQLQSPGFVACWRRCSRSSA
jgi:hypothetical protein